MDTYITYSKKKAGYKDVSETIKVIEKIAASELHALDKKTEALADHSYSIVRVLWRIQQLLETDTARQTVSGRDLCLVFTGDKGLVGDLWQKLFHAYTKRPQQDLLIFGKKGQKQWQENGVDIMHYSFSGRLPTPQELTALTELLNTHIQSGTYQTISTLHMHPASLVEQDPVYAQLLPVVVPEQERDTHMHSAGFPIVEESLHTLEAELHAAYLTSRLQEVILEMAVSEYSSRTIAMEHARTQTNEAQKKLQMVYSRNRRQRETQKQLERFTSHHTTV